MITPEQYINVINTWIYPKIDGLTIKWYKGNQEENSGLFCIHIPPQENDKKPFLISKIVDEKGKATQLVFGYAERKRDGVEPKNIQEIHSSIQSGIRFDSISDRLEEIQYLISNLSPLNQAAQDEASKEASLLLERRIDDAIKDLGFEEKTTYSLGAIPKSLTEMPQLFSHRRNDTAHLVERPPELRHNGFNLSLDLNPKIVNGKYLRSLDRDEGLIDLWKDGTLYTVRNGGPEFLCWGRNVQGIQKNKINQLALLESIYLFVNLAFHVYKMANPLPENIEFKIILQNLNKVNPHILKGGPLDSFGSDHNAPENYSKFCLGVKYKDLDVDLTAYRLVSQVYEWFGLAHDQIPYVKEIDGVRKIDPEQIRKL